MRFGGDSTLWRLSWALVIALALPPSAWAEGPTPPALLKAAEPEPPAAARALTEALELVVSISIDATGQVTGVEVPEPAGRGFDEAAQAAARKFRFTPALREGQPVASRIRYRFAFDPQPSAANAGAPALQPPAADDAGVSAPPQPHAAASEPGGSAPPAQSPAAASDAGRSESPLSAADGAVSASPPAAVYGAGAVASPPIAATQVTVSGERSATKQLLQSAEAVSIIDTRMAKQQSADLGEVLARSPGISVERVAGLGSQTRISLAGLEGAAVPLFVDGIPLDQTGYPALADIPVNLVERVEVYRGVVPIRFGADALGGAINIVTDTAFHAHAGASYQIGSFNTHRATAMGRYQDRELGLVLGASTYFDFTENSYLIDVSVPDMSTGLVRPARVRRRHDDYLAAGGRVDVGVIDKPWAKRLQLSAFVNGFIKENQTNATQSVAYGELHGRSSNYGATLRYEIDFTPQLSAEVVASFAYSRFHFIDLAEWVYDWYGERVRRRNVGGEVDARRKSDLTTWESSVFSRAVVQWAFVRDHALRLATAFSRPWRGGHEAVIIEEGQRDKGDGRRSMLSLVTGLEYEANLFEERLANLAFVKHYYQHSMGEDPLFFVAGDAWATREVTTHRFGVGDSLRYRFAPWLYAKLNYEYATRLPEPTEYLGDGMLILANYQLLPEQSHNGNLGLRLELPELAIGAITADLNGFLRSTDNLIILTGKESQQYVNILSSRSTGFDTAINYVSPARYVAVSGMLTWQDVRNTSDAGMYRPFKDQRVPSQPWLFASWNARLSFPDVLMQRTRLEPFYIGRYVHGFNRSWDNYGDPQFKITLPSQVTHNIGVTWQWSEQHSRLSLTAELTNFTNAKIYDFFGAQRPGRALYIKLTGDLR